MASDEGLPANRIEEVVCELRHYAVLRSWQRDSAGGIMLAVEGISRCRCSRSRLSLTSSRKGVQINPQTIARVTGVLFLITYITAIPAAFVLYPPVLDDPRYIVGPGADNSVLLGAFLELVLIVANIGTAVVLFPVLRRVNEILALGYVAARLVECA